MIINSSNNIEQTAIETLNSLEISKFQKNAADKIHCEKSIENNKQIKKKISDSRIEFLMLMKRKILVIIIIIMMAIMCFFTSLTLVNFSFICFAQIELCYI